MDEQDFQELNDNSWNSWLDNEISPDALDKQLEDNQAEYDKYGF
jgi:hypothetical protein